MHYTNRLSNTRYVLPVIYYIDATCLALLEGLTAKQLIVLASHQNTSGKNYRRIARQTTGDYQTKFICFGYVPYRKPTPR